MLLSRSGLFRPLRSPVVMEPGELGVNTREEAVGSVSRMEPVLGTERVSRFQERGPRREVPGSLHIWRREPGRSQAAGFVSRRKELTCLLLVFVQLFEKESTSGMVQVLRVVGSVSRYQ